MAKHNSSRTNGSGHRGRTNVVAILPQANGLVPAVGYIRMSTNRQEDSPARQRRDREALAERLGYQIISWYEDHGLTGTESTNRPEFRRLLDNAKGGKFRAVLISQQSRMSREDVFDAMLHWKLLRDAGVKIVTCQRGELDFANLGGVITAIVVKYGAREESIKLAQRVVSGQRLKVSQGQRVGGVVFGYDREMHDDTGNLVRRVHFRERFRKPPTWRSRLLPSEDTDAVEGVRWAFDAILDGHSIGHVIHGLNNRGLTTMFGKPFIHSTVVGMLKNPAYAGILRVGKYSRAKFCPLSENGLIIVENAHEPLVPLETFERVQQILRERNERRPHAPRNERRPHAPPEKYLLSTIVVCQHCGNRMYGVRRANREKKVLFHQCNASPAVSPYDPNCPHPAVRTERLESFVLATIRERLLESGAEDRIREAILRAKRKHATKAVVRNANWPSCVERSSVAPRIWPWPSMTTSWPFRSC